MLHSLQLRDATISSGPLPGSLGSLSQLANLQIAGGQNNLGTLPPEWSQLQNLGVLELFNMSLTGQLPSSYTNLTGLYRVNITSVTGLTSNLTDWHAFIKRPRAGPRQQVWLAAMGLQGGLPADIIDPNR